MRLKPLVRAILRPYQQAVKNKVLALWGQGFKNVLAVLPTGAGKTVTFSDILHDHNGAAVAIAHRQELVAQISQALARDGVRHRIIGAKDVVKLCVNNHMDEIGVSYYDPGAPVAVAGVDTLIKRKDSLRAWAQSVSLWVQDEAHHVLTGNKWGEAAEMFPNAYGLGVTATPTRADGKGLGRHADGLFDEMVVGVSMRELIDSGYLTDYRIFAPPSDLDLSDVTIGSTGDYSPIKLKTAVRRSHIVGDVVKHYLRIASGKLGVTFVPDVETANDVAAQFNAAGVPAEVVTAKTPARDRAKILRRFKNRELLQLVNVDLFGEGFDLPAIEVVSMARPTQSYSLYVQQFGRALRLLEGKVEALIIDHVGNVQRHGLPDAPRTWTLDRRESRRSRDKPDDVIPVKVCPSPECNNVYEAVYAACPFCGFKPLPMARNAPEFVDGDLCELDPATLAQMRGEIAKMDRTDAEVRLEAFNKRMPKVGQMAHVNRHLANQQAQKQLRESIAWWGAYQRAANKPDSESYRRFYHLFGVDVLSAQALPEKEATALNARINKNLETLRNV